MVCLACLSGEPMKNIGYKKSRHPQYFRCSRCKSLQLDPMPSSLHLMSYYAELSKSGSYSKAISQFRAVNLEWFMNQNFKESGFSSIMEEAYRAISSNNLILDFKY